MLRVAETIVRTDTGRHRRENEDATYARAPVFVVADGMGGAQAGEVASGIVVQTFARGLPDEGAAEERLASVVRAANSEIYERSRTERQNAGMGTTATAAYVEEDAVAIAHVGDSRAYLLRDGELSKLTSDHSLVEELVRGGRLTEEEALVHPQRSIITRALGPEADVTVDTWSYPLRSGDVVLLCSDGLTDMLPEPQVQELLVEAPDLETGAARLIDAANAAGGRDNITVILFRVQEVSVPAELDQPTQVRPPGDLDQPTQVGMAAVEEGLPGAGPAGPAPDRAVGAGVPVTPPPTRKPTRRAPLARLQGLHLPASWIQPAPSERHVSRAVKIAAATFAVVAAIFLVGGGGYLATRQLYFLGTNKHGTVVVFRGLPYVLPFGIPMYETYYVSGVPASLLPASRRANLLNHAIRDQTGAQNLINDLERGKIVR